METLTKPKSIAVWPLYAIFALFVWGMLFNDSNVEEVPTQKPRTLTFKEVVTTDVYGNYVLQPKRLRKLKRDIENLKKAQQYVLYARFEGWYNCLSCPFRDSIYLYPRQVWKYGVTVNGESGRYRNTLLQRNLTYKIQYEGSIEECMIEERKKIIRYPLLEENILRKQPIARPPGNPKDS